MKEDKERTVVSCPLTDVTIVLVPMVEIRPVVEEDEVGGTVVEWDVSLVAGPVEVGVD